MSINFNTTNQEVGSKQDSFARSASAPNIITRKRSFLNNKKTEVAESKQDVKVEEVAKQNMQRTKSEYFKKSSKSKSDKPVTTIIREIKPHKEISQETKEMLVHVKNAIENDDRESIKLLCTYGSKDQSQSIELSKEIVRIYQNDPATLKSLLEKLTRCDVEAQKEDSFFRNITLSGILSKVIIEQDPEMAPVFAKFEKELINYGNSGLFSRTSASDVVISKRSISDNLRKKMGEGKYFALPFNERDKLIELKINSHLPKFIKYSEKTIASLFDQKLPENVRQILAIRRSVIEQSEQFKHLAIQGVSDIIFLRVFEQHATIALGANPEFKTDLDRDAIRSVACVIQKFAKETSKDEKGTPISTAFEAIQPKLQDKFNSFINTNSIN